MNSEWDVKICNNDNSESTVFMNSCKYKKFHDIFNDVTVTSQSLPLCTNFNNYAENGLFLGGFYLS